MASAFPDLPPPDLPGYLFDAASRAFRPTLPLWSFTRSRLWPSPAFAIWSISIGNVSACARPSFKSPGRWGGEGDYRFAKSCDRDPFAANPAIFTSLEESLVSQGKLTDIGPNFDYAQWTQPAFHDGQLVRVAGMVRLLDYPWLASVMETMPRMLKGNPPRRSCVGPEAKARRPADHAG